MTDSVYDSAAKHIIQSEIMEFSLGALSNILADMYKGRDSSGLTIKAFLCPNRNVLRKYYQKAGSLEPESLPLIGYLPTSFSIEKQSYNRQALQHLGKTLGLSKNGQDWIIGHLTPVTIEIAVVFVGNNYNQFIRFTKRWLQYNRDLTFSIGLADTDQDIKIAVEGQDQLQAPDLPSESDNGEMFIYETGLVMKTYTGILQKIPGVIEIQGNMRVLSKTDIIAIHKESKDYSSINSSLFTLKLAPPTNPEL